MNLDTKNLKTWCPGCANYSILEAVKKALTELKLDPKNLAMVTGIGCHAKIFDYLNISGFYGLHGRVLPTALGIKMANPNLTLLGFAGDGDTYAEGIAHFMHMGRYNPNMTFIVHDNQSFSLTTGQPSPTTQQNYKHKSLPFGEKNPPLNPVKLALASGISFIARCNALDIPHTTQILKKAILHKGFSFVEIIQRCLIFNTEMAHLDKLMYKVNNKTKTKALRLVEEWDYNTKKGKIPIGIFYQEKKPLFEEKYPPLLKHLTQKKL